MSDDRPRPLAIILAHQPGLMRIPRAAVDRNGSVEAPGSSFNDADSWTLATNAFPDQKSSSDEECGGWYVRL